MEERELAVQWDKALWQWVHKGNAEEYRRSEDRNEILELLAKEDEPLSPKEIADAVSKKDTAVRQLLRSMVQDGQVVRHGEPPKTRYTLPEDDHDHHDDHGPHDHHDDHGSTPVEDPNVFDLGAEKRKLRIA